MLLQELFKKENEELKSAYAIEIDANSTNPEFSTPPQNLEEIGFIFKVDSDGMLDENLMDIVISYRLTNLPIVMEVDPELIVSGKLEVKYLMQLANNVDFSIALLPPTVGCSMDQYKDIINKVLDEIFAKPNFDKFIYPVSNFMEYLMLEYILGKDKLANFRPEDKFVQASFSSVMTKQDSDDFKALIRNRLYDFYGGEKAFGLVAQTIMEGVLDKSKEAYKDFVTSLVASKNQTSQ